MIYNLNKDFYGPRYYLSQWFFEDILVVTDLDIWKCKQFGHENTNELMSQWLQDHPCKNVVVDLSQNCFISHQIPDCLRNKPTFTSIYDEWYSQSAPNMHFFPIWMYTFSQRNNIRNEYCNVFDALGTKTQGAMCLNRGGRNHRIKFYNLIKDYETQMCLTVPVDASMPWQNKRLPGDTLLRDGLPQVDLSVEHPVYSQYAVNVVTETQINYPSITEKCCKPFIARQIPVIVGNAGVNQFHVDIGFDMFEDIVPWRTWDHHPDENIKLEKIAEFIKQWIDSGTILDDYHRVQDRVERNKQYFHSEQFRDLIMKNMPKINPYQLSR
jgi:hypothetical protein